MRTLAYLYTCVLTAGLTACGGGSTETEEVYGPLFIPDVDFTPGCYVEPPSVPSTGLSTAQLQQLSALRSQLDFRRSLLFQQAIVLSGPIVEDPTASRWEQRLDTGVRVEGAALARGEGWAVIKMIAGGLPAGWRMWSATIDVTPEQTRYTFDNGVLDLHADYVRMDDAVWGCEPHSGASFSIGPGVVDGQIVGDARQCWWRSGLIVSAAAPPPPEDGELASSAWLQCLQLIAKATLE